MGALLSILLASEVGDSLDGLVLIGAALKISSTSHLGVMLSRIGVGKLIPYTPKSDSGGDIGDPAARALNPTYPSMPLEAVSQFDEVRRQAMDVLSDVRVPTCLLHGAKDSTALPESSELIAERISAPWFERHSFARSHHIIGLDYEREAVAKTVLRFVHGLLPPEPKNRNTSERTSNVDAH